MGIVGLYIIVYAHHKRARAQSELHLDFGHFYLVHAKSTKLKEIGTQHSLRKEVGNVLLSSDKLDSELSTFGIVTVLEESHLHVLVFAGSLRIVRSKDRSQVATVQWRWRNECSIRAEVSCGFLTGRHLVEATDGRNNKAAFK